MWCKNELELTDEVLRLEHKKEGSHLGGIVIAAVK